MNLIAIDIGNTRIKVAFFLDDEEKLVKSVSTANDTDAMVVTGDGGTGRVLGPCAAGGKCRLSR